MLLIGRSCFDGLGLGEGVVPRFSWNSGTSTIPERLWTGRVQRLRAGWRFFLKKNSPKKVGQPHFAMPGNSRLAQAIVRRCPRIDALIGSRSCHFGLKSRAAVDTELDALISPSGRRLLRSYVTRSVEDWCRYGGSSKWIAARRCYCTRARRRANEHFGYRMRRRHKFSVAAFRAQLTCRWLRSKP